MLRQEFESEVLIGTAAAKPKYTNINNLAQFPTSRISETKLTISGINTPACVFYYREWILLGIAFDSNAVIKKTNGAPSLYPSLFSISDTDGCLLFMSPMAEVETALHVCSHQSAVLAA